MQKACKLFLFLKDSHAFITSSVKFTASRSTQQFVYSAVPHPTENNQSVHTLCTGTVFKSNNHTAVFFNGLHNFHRSSAHWTSCDQNTMFLSFILACCIFFFYLRCQCINLCRNLRTVKFKFLLQIFLETDNLTLPILQCRLCLFMRKFQNKYIFKTSYAYSHISPYTLNTRSSDPYTAHNILKPHN